MTCEFKLGTADSKDWLDQQFTFDLTMKMYSNEQATRGSFIPLEVTRTINLEVVTCNRTLCSSCDENDV